MKKYLDNKFYPNHGNNWDDQLFRERILKELRSDFLVLDLGAGAGIIPFMNFRGMAKKICGIDLDPRVVENPFLDEGKVADANKIPYPDESFDLIFSDNVMEHLDQPLLIFKEVKRVLKPGGLFLIKTPNKYHYVPTISRLTPHSFHQYVNKLRGRDEDDTFPTHYLANSHNQLTKLAKDSDLKIESLDLIEGRPEYLRGIWPAYLLGILYERTVNAFSFLKSFRVIIIGCFQR
jgi:SAM-dependent methyltransferase